MTATLADGRPKRRPRRLGWVWALLTCALIGVAGASLYVLQPETARSLWASASQLAQQGWTAAQGGAGVAARWTERQVDRIEARITPEPMGPDVLLEGAYEPADDAAREVGAILFEAATVTIVEAPLKTRPGAIVLGEERMSLRQTWAEALGGGAREQVEVRQVVTARGATGVVPGLCGDQPVGWIALQPRGRDLTVAAFGVGERPAADMAGADLCGVLRYSKS